MSELESLAELLLSKSLEGKIKWTGWTPTTNVRLQTRQGDNYIEISSNINMDPAMNFLSVRNRNGILLAQEGFEFGKKAFTELDEIFGIVRRQSLGVEGALSDLRARLEAL